MFVNVVVQSMVCGMGVPSDFIVTAAGKAILKIEKKQKQKQSAVMLKKKQLEKQKRTLAEQVAALKKTEALLFQCSKENSEEMEELQQKYNEQKENKTILEFTLIADMLDTCSNKYAKKAWFMINNKNYRNAI